MEQRNAVAKICEFFFITLWFFTILACNPNVMTSVMSVAPIDSDDTTLTNPNLQPSDPIPDPDFGETPPPNDRWIPPPVWERAPLNQMEWTAQLKQFIAKTTPKLLTTNVYEDDWLCPGLNQMTKNERLNFWTYFLSLMALHESGLKTAAKYTESFADSQGRRVISRGLLQISIESSKGYNCGMTAEAELHNEMKNLTCGLRIISRWVANDFRTAYWIQPTARGASRYWSVLRKANKNSWNDIEKKITSLKVCH